MELFEWKMIDFQNEDERGKLVQLVHDDVKQVNVLESFKGTYRGGHLHRKCTESFYVLKGMVKVTLTLGDESEEVVFTTNDFFRIKPFVSHSMHFKEDTIMVVMYDRAIEDADGAKDIFSA